MAITAQTRTDIVQLVVSMLGAAPSTKQLTDLVTKANAGSSIQELADYIASDNADFAANYPVWLTAKEFTAKVVDNMFSGGTVSTADRDAAVDYIAGAITAGTFTKTSAVVALTSYMASADGIANASYGSASQAYQNKVEVAEYYTITKGQGGNSAADLAAAIAGVTSDAASVTSSKATVDAEIAADAAAATAAADAAAAAAVAAATKGQDDTLTTGLNNITGTANDDTVSALPTTLTVGDSYDGLGGNDTVSLTSALNGNTSVAGFTLTNIENLGVNVTSAAAGAETLTLNLATTDSDKVTLSGLGVSTANDTLALTNVAGGTTVAMSSATDLNLTANFVATATAGTTAKGTPDTVNVEVSAITRTAGGDNTITIGNGFENMNLKSSGAASRLDQITSNSTTMSITGDANLTIDTDLDASLYSIDATNFSGKLAIATTNNAAPDLAVGGIDIADVTIVGGSGKDTINVANNAADNEINVSGGAGDDTIVIGADLVAANALGTNPGDVLDGGEGVDILSFTSAGFAALTKAKTTQVSGFETLNVANALANTITAANAQATGITTVNLGAGGTGGVVMPAGASTVALGASLTGALTLTDTGTAQTDSVTLANSATAADDMGDANNITVSGFETLNILTTAVGDTSQDFGSITITGDPDGDTAATTALTVSGSDRASVGAVTATSIDASGMTAAATGTTFNMTVAPTSVVTVTGSEGADTLRGDAKSTINGNGGNDIIVGGTGNDTLNGGAGKDNITLGTGSDTVNGGAGNDTIVAAGNLTALDKVDGGDGTDTLSATNASLVALQGLTISEANTFNTSFNSIETLQVTDAMDSTNDNFDLGYLGGINSVTLSTLATDAETISGFASGGVLTLSQTLGQTLTATVSGAAANADDALTVALVANADDNYGTLALGNIETVTVNSTQATANAASQTGTLTLNITQTSVLAGGSGAAQTVNFTGSEDITLGAALNAATISGAGMSARLATTPGLVMNSAATATLAMPGQTITGSSGADTLFGSTGADTINAGAGNDIINGSTGGDIIDGGTGSNTFNTAGMVGANIEGTGTGTSTGVVVNLGSAALSNVNVLNNASQNLSGAQTSVPAGTTAYVYNTVANTFATAAKTISNVNNVDLSTANGINYVIGNDNANTITLGSGNDHVISGKGADIITGTAGDNIITTGAGNDIINGGTGTNIDTSDVINAGTGTDTLNVTNVAGTATIDDSVGLENITVVDTAGGNDMTIAVTFTADSTQDIKVDGSVLDAGEDLTVNMSDANADGDYTIIGGAGADILTGGDGDAIITGGLGIDVITGDVTGDDIFIFATAVEAGATVYAGADVNKNKMDTLTTFETATDTIQLGTGAAAFGTGITFTSATVMNVSTATTLGTADYADLAAVATALETASAGTASDATTAQAIVVTIAADATTAGDFDTNSAGKYLVINDATAAWGASDTWISIGTLTGTMAAADFTFV